MEILITGKIILDITIPNYPKQVQLSAAKRPKYYKEGQVCPKKYTNAQYGYDKKILINLTTKEKIVKNTRTVGKPNMKTINNSILYSSDSFTKHTKAKIMNALEDFYRTSVDLRHAIVDSFKGCICPLSVIIEFYGSTSSDIDNQEGFYRKVLHDFFTKQGAIPDDNVGILNTPISKFIKHAEEKMRIVVFEADNKPIIITSTR